MAQHHRASSHNLDTTCIIGHRARTLLHASASSGIGPEHHLHASPSESSGSGPEHNLHAHRAPA
eukprot:575903-Rhodomonas_salina.2